MTPDSSLGNIVSRLKGLKNVSGRRIMPGDNYLERFSPPEMDLGNISSPIPKFSNALPWKNSPPVDNTSPQGSDVRANQVEPIQPPAPQEDEGFFTKFGRGMKAAYNMSGRPPVDNMAQSPPVETQQVDVQKGVEPVSASQQEAAGMQPPSPDGVQQPPQEPPQQESSDKKEPFTFAEQGAAAKAYSDPAQRAEWERIMGVNITPEMEQQIASMEKVLQTLTDEKAAYTTRLTESEQHYRKKIQERDLSTKDQILMALALVAPAILAGVTMGKEGFFGVLGGGAGAAGKVLSDREDKNREDEKNLDLLAREKYKTEKDFMPEIQKAEEMKAKILESIPNRGLRELFARDGKMQGNRFVLKTGNPLLEIESSKIRTPEDEKRIKEKVLPEMEKKVGKAQTVLNLVDKMDNIIETMTKSQQAGMPGLSRNVPGYDTVARGAKAFLPNLRDEFVDENGKEVKADVLYNTYRENLYDAYRQIVKGTQSAASKSHFDEMVPDPFAKMTFAGGKSDLANINKGLIAFKESVEDAIKNDLTSAGFAPEPIEELFSKSNVRKKQAEEARKKTKANEAVKESLGKK